MKWPAPGRRRPGASRGAAPRARAPSGAAAVSARGRPAAPPAQPLALLQQDRRGRARGPGRPPHYFDRLHEKLGVGVARDLGGSIAASCRRSATGRSGRRARYLPSSIPPSSSRPRPFAPPDRLRSRSSGIRFLRPNARRAGPRACRARRTTVVRSSTISGLISVPTLDGPPDRRRDHVDARIYCFQLLQELVGGVLLLQLSMFLDQ